MNVWKTEIGPALRYATANVTKRTNPANPAPYDTWADQPTGY